MKLPSTDFESAASASSAIPAFGWAIQSVSQAFDCAQSRIPAGESRQCTPIPCENEGSAMTTTSALVPEPVAVTPQLLATHGIIPDEYERILKALGRVPSLTELGIYSVMWREWSAALPVTATVSVCPTLAVRPSLSPATAAIRWSTRSRSEWCARTRSSMARQPALATRLFM